MVDNSDSKTVPAGSVLVVDDVEVNRDLLARRLRQQGHQVTLAEGGSQALEVINGNAFDLVLLDIMMPDVDGLEVLRTVRKTYSDGELPIIMVTAVDRSSDIVESLKNGANDYVTKPIDFPVLLARTNAQLKRKWAEAALLKAQEELEQRVEDRTAELRRAYNVLKQESVERQLAQKQLSSSEELYRTLYDDNPSTFFTVTADHTLKSLNRFGASRLGFEVDELVGADLAMLHVDKDREFVAKAIDECLQNPGAPNIWEVRMRHKDDSVSWVRATGKAVVSKDGSVNVLVVCEDITEARRLSKQLSYEASHDALTGLFNRREFEIRLQRALETTQAENVEHVVCYFDLDQFKIINDTCGHVAGDELLRQLAAELKDQLRTGDTLARLGGDEFGVLLENCPLKFAKRVAATLLQTIGDFQFAWDNKSFTVGASIGLVAVDNTNENINDLLIAADSACYAAKDHGRNRVHVYQADDKELAQRHGEMQWVIRIKRALEQDRFRLFAQTIAPIDTDANSGKHYEVLVRLVEEDGTVVPPGAFLPAAERYNISTSIDRWVFRATLEWLRRHTDHLDELSMCSINLSGLSLGDEGFLDDVILEFSEFGIPPGKICFEITETAAISNLQSAIRFINKLRGLGCKFALDDFGSGLSSFAYLRNLPVDYLKIDGVFVKDIAVDPVSLAMVKSINEIGHVMGMQTIAEFVEDDAILAKLAELGVDFAQGYGIAKPEPIEENL
ncbi:MAG: EAL domain-containing protein [Proteobacteria bacterium]|nr:EAL domain-containing protein [Pseudomonadota bacterium]